MIKRVCDRCGKEIDKTKPHAEIEISVVKNCGVLGPEYQFDLCNACMNKLLKECGVNDENLGR